MLSRYFLIALLSIGLFFSCSEKKQVKVENRILSLNSSDSEIRWKVIPQDSIGEDSLDIFEPGYDLANWVPAVVPGTVFNSYVEAGLEKDPNYADNIYKVDTAKYDRNFWYRAIIKIPEQYENGRTWLNFEGINRAADIFLNSKKLGHLEGFMDRGTFDISGIASKESTNVLAVLVHWPQAPIPNYASPTYISSAGWDWMPYVPGLLMGITDDVYLSNSGDVTIKDPWIRTLVPSKDKAELIIQTQVINHSDSTRVGTFKGIIRPGNIEFEKDIQLAGKDTATITFDKNDFPQLLVDNPKLWWPNGYGDPNLYTANLTFHINGKLSDADIEQFGIKEYSYKTINNTMRLSINGEPVFLKGGNWGMSEYMLRCRGEEYFTKIRLHKEMNFNMIRNWIGSTTDEEFYEACDKYGIMVWDDFWLNSHRNLPRELKVFNKNAIEKIKRLRNHPSIAIWCGDNEGTPLPPMNDWLQEDVEKYDANDRLYQPQSNKGGGLSGSGPWTNAAPATYFIGYDGFGGDENVVKGLRSEVGTAVFTTLESFKKFMPEDKLWPRNEMWNKHFFGPSGGNAGPDHYESSINERYGKARGIKDFTQKAQLLNLETNKAMFEGWRHSQWDQSSGLLIWMSQSAYPSLVWQTYDYYYDLNGAFWGAKRGSEPVHIQWSAADNTVKVINGTLKDLKNVIAEAAVYNMNGEKYDDLGGNVRVDAPKHEATMALKINFNESNLAKGKEVKASSASDGADAGNAADGSSDTRWSSGYNNDEWIYVDLGKKQEIAKIKLVWEAAYGKSFKVQLSDDAKNWKDVYETAEGDGGTDEIAVNKQMARYVRMLGKQRGTMWGYSLHEIEVYGPEEENVKQLSPVHFIKLKLKDSRRKLLSENFYWRGEKKLDYTALNNLKPVDLDVTRTNNERDGKYLVNTTITNPENSNTVALAVRVKLVNSKTGNQYLPTFKTDSYFSLLPGESKEVELEVAKDIIGEDTPKLVVEPYNNVKE